MILKLHGSMGDHLMATGIPEAYFKLYNEKTFIDASKYKLFWNSNPYITNERIGQVHSLIFNTHRDYLIYYPTKIFYDITGRIVDRDLVQPNVYTEYSPKENLVVINDQAGWPTRRGYPYLEDLSKSLMQSGFKVVYLRNDTFRDCNNKVSSRTVHSFDSQFKDKFLEDIIDLFKETSFYIGYESGLSSLAGAIGTKYILIEGSVPATNVAHNSCIYVLKNTNCHYCAAENCERLCLSHSENKNEEILKVIKEWKNLQ